MKRPKMNQWERELYRLDATNGHLSYCRIQFAKLFKDMGLYKLQAKIKNYLSKKGIHIIWKSEKPADYVDHYTKEALKQKYSQ